MTDKVIFLDIDGPMIPSSMFLIDRMCSLHRRFPETTVAVLNELCKRTGAKIVFNSTHNRSWESAPDIQVALVDQGLDADHVRSSDWNTAYPDLPRDVAVKAWLHAHPEVTDWVALDDCKFTEDERLIWIDPDAGLHVGHLNNAIKLLGGKPVLVLM
jgi:hypothetical protein